MNPGGGRHTISMGHSQMLSKKLGSAGTHPLWIAMAAAMIRGIRSPMQCELPIMFPCGITGVIIAVVLFAVVVGGITRIAVTSTMSTNHGSYLYHMLYHSID